MTENEHLLAIIAVECAGIALRAVKALRFGLRQTQPGQPLNNEERIREEYSDLVGVMEMLGIHPVRELVEAKKQKVLRYLELSRSLGTLAEKIEESRNQPRRLYRCEICISHGCWTCHDQGERCGCARDGRT